MAALIDASRIRCQNTTIKPYATRYINVTRQQIAANPLLLIIVIYEMYSYKGTILLGLMQDSVILVLSGWTNMSSLELKELMDKPLGLCSRGKFTKIIIVFVVLVGM